MRQWWLFSVFFLTTNSFAGSSCEPVDLRELIGPPLHQGDSSYCFAHTSSSLLQAKLGFRVSPMQLATHYILANPEELNGAAPLEVKRLLTPEFFAFWKKDRSSEPENFLPEQILTETGLLDTGGEELPTLLATNFLGLCLESRLPTGVDVYKNYLEEINAFHKLRVERGIPPEEKNRPLGEVMNPEARGMAWSYRHWVEGRCGQRVMPSRPILPRMTSLAPSLEAFRKQEAAGVLMAGMRNKVVQAINASLDRGQPISIGYALGDLLPSKNQGVGEAEVDHASIIAGRRLSAGKCYYFLRNSFGDDLEGYHPRFQGRLESGGVWVLPEELPSLYNTVWLE